MRALRDPDRLRHRSGKARSCRRDDLGTGKVPDEKIEKAIAATFDLTPAAIIRSLDLLKPIYRETAAYGHFGRDGFTWERTDKVDVLKAKLA